MAAYLAISVDIDAASVLNAAQHADMAVENGIMTRSEAVGWLSEDLSRYVSCADEARRTPSVST